MEITSMIKELTNKSCIAGVMLLLLLLSCQQKPRNYVGGFERFVVQIEQNASSYTSQDWENNDVKFEDYLERFNGQKAKLTTEEKKKIGELTARYYKARVKSVQNTVMNELNDWADFIEGFTNEIIGEIEN